MEQLFQKFWWKEDAMNFHSLSLLISKSSTKIEDANVGQVWWDKLP